MNPYVDIASCALCESPAGNASVLFDLNEEQKLLCCSTCGLIYNNRCRTDFEDIYDNDYYEGTEKSHTGGYFAYSQMEKATNRTDRFATSFIRSHSSRRGNKVRLLDVGCGYGFFLKQFKEDGNIELVGIEASRRAAEEASKFITNIIHERIENVSFDEAARFDFVAAFEVLEHLIDPAGFLRKVHGFLKDHGYLFLSMPDIGSLWFKLLGRRWPGIHPYYHNIYFSNATVRSLACKCGFEVVKIRSKQYYYTNVRHIRKRLLELSSGFGRVFVLLKPLDSFTVPFLNGGDLQVILRKNGSQQS